MEKKVIDLEVTSNIGESISDLKALKRQLKDTAAGSEEFKKIFNQIDDLEDKIKSAKSSSSDWIDSLENAGGPLGMVGAGLNKAKVATQSFGGALKATGIGLFVSLIGGLVAAFSENEGAMKKIQPLIDGLKKAFQGVFRAVEPLFNTFVDLATDALPYVTKGIGMVYSAMMAYFTFLKESGGGALKILKGIFTLDSDAISSGIDQIGGSFKKTTTAYTDSMKRFSEGSKELTETEKEEAEKREEARKKALEKKEAAEEKSKQAAIKKAQEEAAALKAIADKKLADDMKSAQDALNIITALNQSYETPAQKETREYEEKKAVLEANNLSTELLTQKHLENLAGIAKTDAEKKAAEDAKIAADKKKIADDTAKEELDREKAVAEGKKAIQEASFNVASNGISLLKTVFEKNKGIQKGLILAESAVGLARIVTNTQAANAADRLYAATMGPAGAGYLATKIPLNYVGAAIGSAANIAATAKALSALGGGGAGSAPSGGSAGGGGAAPQFNVVGNSGVNQLADVMNTKEQTPVKAYVVPSDVTTGQSLDRNIIRNASLG